MTKRLLLILAMALLLVAVFVGAAPRHDETLTLALSATVHGELAACD